MERLQAAIEKARAQREGPGKPTRNAAPMMQREPASEDRSAPDDVWLAVPEIEISHRRLLRNRVMSFQGGAASAPYDVLRTRMVNQAKSQGWRRIAIVSPHSSTGKTTTTANLAFGLARHYGLRSIVLDTDLRRNELGQLLGQTGQVPMADVLNGHVPFTDIARRYGSNLIFGLGFGTVKNPSEVLQGPRAEEVLSDIEATYTPDFMIFDLPPLSAGDDNLGFLSRVDAALIVVEAEKTSMTQIDVAERTVSELTNVMGIVLNKCRFVSGAYGYEEGYY